MNRAARRKASRRNMCICGKPMLPKDVTNVEGYVCHKRCKAKVVAALEAKHQRERILAMRQRLDVAPHTPEQAAMNLKRAGIWLPR